MAIIKEFILNTKDIHSTGEARPFSIVGDADAVFSLEIKNEDGNFYNFFNNTFQANKISLSNQTVTGGIFVGNIVFPAVSDADHYDISLFAGDNTEHAEFQEVRFADDSLDINSSTGSNSKLLQKKIFQTLLTLLKKLSQSGKGSNRYIFRELPASMVVNWMKYSMIRQRSQMQSQRIQYPILLQPEKIEKNLQKEQDHIVAGNRR